MEFSTKLIVLISAFSTVHRVKSLRQNYGDLANIEDHPYYAYLTDGLSKTLKCSGAIIASNLILTAAHCLDRRDFQVYVGASSSRDLNDLTPYHVSDVLKHPGSANSRDDIGLVKLREEIVLGPKVQVIGFASEVPPIDVEAEIIGFGKVDCTDDYWDSTHYTCDSIESENLRSVRVKIVGTGDRVVFTNGGSLNTCPGDSGGPLVYNHELVGIVSAGPHNGCSNYNIQVSIANKTTWIEYNMKHFR